MRWIRLLAAVIAARFKPRLSVFDPSVVRFRVWLTDIDVSYMNHAALLTVMETGRIDLMVRSGFFKIAREHKWYFPTSAINVRFLRPLRLWQQASLLTRVFYVDEKWIYLEHQISTNNGKQIACCIVKGKIKKGRETLDPRDVIRELGEHHIPGEQIDLIMQLQKTEEDLNEFFQEKQEL